MVLVCGKGVGEESWATSLRETRVSTPPIMRHVTACFRLRLLTAAEMELSLPAMVGSSALYGRGLGAGDDAGPGVFTLPADLSRGALAGVSCTTMASWSWDSRIAGADLRGFLAFDLVAVTPGERASVDGLPPVIRCRSSRIFQTQ